MTHHGGEATTWKCVKKLGAVAYVDGEIACATVDGKNCLTLCKKGKLKKLPPNIKPLKCTADIKSKWCTRAKALLPELPKAKAVPVVKETPATPPQPPTVAPTVAPTKAISPEPSPAAIPSVYAQQPLEPEIVEPVPEKNRRSPFDYVFYLIELLVSVAAITVALVTTTGSDWTIRLLHLVVAIMFKYVYIGYFLLNNFNLF